MFTATLNSVQRSGDPASFDLGLTYSDSTAPDWHIYTTLRVVVDPALTGAQQRAALVETIRADAARYQQQAAIYAGLLSLVGQTVTLA